jgi:spermidine dehydrogenase
MRNLHSAVLYAIYMIRNWSPSITGFRTETKACIVACAVTLQGRNRVSTENDNGDSMNRSEAIVVSEPTREREDITRRDFIGSALVGSGARLLGMASPAALHSARAQTTGLPMTGLGPDWTGPGGIGDYANSNGNTADVVNSAHGDIRNDQLRKMLDGATDTGERYDAIIIGCGIAGLSAGWIYSRERPNARLLLLDQHPIFGGEAKQNEFEVDGYRLTAPQGSTGIVVPFATAKRGGFYSHFAADLGWPDEFVFQKPTGLTKDILVPHDVWTPMHLNWDQSDIGYYYEGKGWVKNVWRNGFRDAPIPEASKIALVTTELYKTAPRRDDWARWLDSMTYEQFLQKVVGIDGEALQDVTRYLNPQMAAAGCGLGADVISAYSAYNFLMPGVNAYSRYENGGTQLKDELYLASFPGGNAGTARLLVKKMIPGAFRGEYNMAEVFNNRVEWEQLDRPNQPVRLRVSSTVLSVEHEGHPDSAKGVVVTYLNAGKLHKVRAKAAICAGQQHVNRHICRDVPSEYREAMNTFHHAPMLTVNVAVRNWKFLENLGIASARWFDGFGWWLSLRRNLEIPGQSTMPLDPSKPFVFSMYNPFPLPGIPFPQQCTAARMQLFSMPYRQIEMSVREQLTKLFGDYGFDAQRDIAGIITNRWGHAYVVDPPGFFFGKDGKPAPRDIIRQRYNRMAFCHAELNGMQVWDTAAAEGERAAKQILEMS